MSLSNKFTVVERPTFKILCKVLMQFFVSEFLNSMILLIKKNRIYEFDEVKYNGINLGSSSACPKRWIGISGGITIFFTNLPLPLLQIIFPFTSRSKKMAFREFKENIQEAKILHHNLYYSIPFRDAVVSNVFSSHFFEHLTPETAKFVACEAYRVLKPGGLIRITVPSLDTAVGRMKEAIQSYENGNQEGVRQYLTEKYVRLTDTFSHHRNMYNFNTLSQLLRDCGFENIVERTSGNGEIPEVEILDTRKGLFVEAIKPGDK